MTLKRPSSSLSDSTISPAPPTAKISGSLPPSSQPGFISAMPMVRSPVNASDTIAR